MSNGKTGKRGYQMPGPKLHTSRAHSTHVTPPITPKVLTGGGTTHTGGFTKPNGGGNGKLSKTFKKLSKTKKYNPFALGYKFK